MSMVWNAVTWYSKFVAVIVFVGAFFLGLWLGNMQSHAVPVVAPSDRLLQAEQEQASGASSTEIGHAASSTLTTISLAVLSGSNSIDNLGNAASFIAKDTLDILEEEGGIPMGKNIHYDTVSLDLNHDGHFEYVTSNLRVEDNYLSGAMGNDVFSVYGMIGGRWKRIAIIAGRVGDWSQPESQNTSTSTTTQGASELYPTITSWWSLGGGMGVHYTYEWNPTKMEYVLINSEKTLPPNKG